MSNANVMMVVQLWQGARQTGEYRYLWRAPVYPMTFNVSARA